MLKGKRLKREMIRKDKSSVRGAVKPNESVENVKGCLEERSYLCTRIVCGIRALMMILLVR